MQSDLAHKILKGPYSFDFLTIQGEAHERAVKDGLIAHMRDFLLKLGQGFAFVGSQVPLTFADQEFFIDLLFYHLHLRCYVVIELKAMPFKPDHTGQLGFHMAVVDDQFREKEVDNPTIGISEYALSKAIPADLKASLPTIEELEAEFNQRLGADQHSLY